MKNNHHSILLAATLFLIAAGLLGIGCSKDRSRSLAFEAEKLYNEAEKLRQTASIKPGLAGPQTQQDLKNAYLKVTQYCWARLDSLPIDKYPEERKILESVAFMGVNRLTQIYVAEKKYDSVISVNRQLLNFTGLEGISLVTARLNLARGLQLTGKLDKAVNIYHTVIDATYPPVDNNNEIILMVLNLPRDIVSIYKYVGDDSSATRETLAAEKYYLKLIRDWPNSALATAARSNLAGLYFDAGNWDKAIDNLTMLKDSTGEIDIEAALMIGAIMADGKKDYDGALALYEKLAGRVTDTMIVPLIEMRKATAFYEKQDYDKCREIMSKINKDHSYFFRFSPIPQKYIALSFEKSGDWFRAENEFRWLIDNYSATEAAFDAYLAVAEHYEKDKNQNMAETWYRRAIEFYQSMANRYAGSTVEASAISYLAEVARRQGKWDLAAQYLENLYGKYPDTEIGRRGLLMAADVYREKLNNGAKADSLIGRLKAELFPPADGKNINIMSDDNKYKP